MKALLAGALVLLTGGAAQAQAPKVCTPPAFARGECDTLDPSPLPDASGPLRLEPRPDHMPDARDRQPPGPGALAPAQALVASEPDWSKLRRDVPRVMPGGVPSMRPDARPAVVVPLLTF